MDNNEELKTVEQYAAEEAKLREESQFRRIVVIGAGGVGFWLTAALARARLKQNIVVFDADTFQGGHGHERLPYVYDRTRYKVDQLYDFITMILNEDPPTTYPYRLTIPMVQDLITPTDLVVDCTDMDLGPRRLLWEALRATAKAVIRVSYDGNGIVVVSNGLPFGPDEAPGGYDRIPSFAQSLRAGGTGAEVVLKMLKGDKFSDLQMEV